MDIVAECISNLFLPERRMLFIQADNVLAKYDYDAHLQDIELTLLSEKDTQDNGYLRDRINDIYKDHITKLLLMHGIDVYGFVTDLSLLTNMLDTIVLAQYQSDVSSVLNMLVLDAQDSGLDVFGKLVMSLTTSEDVAVLTAIKSFDDNLLVKLKQFLLDTKPSLLEVNPVNENSLIRYKAFLGIRRTGLVYQYVSQGNIIGGYKAKELFTLMEDGFKLIHDNASLQFELLSLVLASDTPNPELLKTLRFFSRLSMETPALQLQFYNQMVAQLPPLDNLVLVEESV